MYHADSAIWCEWSSLDTGSISDQSNCVRLSRDMQLGTLAKQLVEWRCASAPLPSLLRRLQSLRAVLDAVRVCFASGRSATRQVAE
jgi:hypothetical protein